MYIDNDSNFDLTTSVEMHVHNIYITSNVLIFRDLGCF